MEFKNFYLHPYHANFRPQFRNWLQQYDYEIHSDGSISIHGQKYDKNKRKVKGDADVSFSAKPTYHMPFKFKKVVGNFFCASSFLESLEGCPEEVTGVFSCIDNNIETLKGGPKIVGQRYLARGNHKLISLEGGPDFVGDEFTVNKTSIKNLIGGPTKVHIYDVSECPHLESFAGAPKSLTPNERSIFSFSKCGSLTSLDNLPVAESYNYFNTNFSSQDIESAKHSNKIISAMGRGARKDFEDLL
jgi:hypothetical protein